MFLAKHLLQFEHRRIKTGLNCVLNLVGLNPSKSADMYKGIECRETNCTNQKSVQKYQNCIFGVQHNVSTCQI